MDKIAFLLVVSTSFLHLRTILKYKTLTQLRLFVFSADDPNEAEPNEAEPNESDPFEAELNEAEPFATWSLGNSELRSSTPLEDVEQSFLEDVSKLQDDLREADYDELNETIFEIASEPEYFREDERQGFVAKMEVVLNSRTKDVIFQKMLLLLIKMFKLKRTVRKQYLAYLFGVTNSAIGKKLEMLEIAMELVKQGLA